MIIPSVKQKNGSVTSHQLWYVEDRPIRQVTGIDVSAETFTDLQALCTQNLEGGQRGSYEISNYSQSSWIVPVTTTDQSLSSEDTNQLDSLPSEDAELPPLVTAEDSSSSSETDTDSDSDSEDGRPR